MPEKIKVICTRCKKPFRESVRSVLTGYQTQCPHCYRRIFFENDATDRGVRRAMAEARRIKKARREALIVTSPAVQPDNGNSPT